MWWKERKLGRRNDVLQDKSDGSWSQRSHSVGIGYLVTNSLIVIVVTNSLIAIVVTNS